MPLCSPPFNPNDETQAGSIVKDRVMPDGNLAFPHIGRWWGRNKKRKQRLKIRAHLRDNETIASNNDA